MTTAASTEPRRTYPIAKTIGVQQTYGNQSGDSPLINTIGRDAYADTFGYGKWYGKTICTAYYNPEAECALLVWAAGYIPGANKSVEYDVRYWLADNGFEPSDWTVVDWPKMIHWIYENAPDDVTVTKDPDGWVTLTRSDGGHMHLGPGENPYWLEIVEDDGDYDYREYSDSLNPNDYDSYAEFLADVKQHIQG